MLQITLKGNRRLYWWYPVWSDMERMCFLVISVIYIYIYLSLIRLANCSKSRNNCCLILFSFVTGVSINLSPFASTLTWWSVNAWSERFLRYFSFFSLSVISRLCIISFLGFLRLLFLDSLSATVGMAAVYSEMTLFYFSTCLLSLWKRVHIRFFNSESWCSSMSIVLTSVLTMFLKGERGFSRVFITLFFERDLAILAFSSLFLWLTSLRWRKRIRARTNCSSAWLLMALISCWKVSSGVTFAFALYWSDLGKSFVLSVSPV